MGGEFDGPSPEAPRRKSGSLRGLLRVTGLAFIGGLVLLILFVIVIVVVAMHNPVAAGATLVKALIDVKTLASTVDLYQAHMGAPPATLAELLSPATNARGQTAGPFMASILTPAYGFSDYRYERHADGHWTITTSGQDACHRPHRIEATSEGSMTDSQTASCGGWSLSRISRDSR